jgi:hypothetical protein
VSGREREREGERERERERERGREREREGEGERERERELYYELSIMGGLGRRPRTDSASPRYGLLPHTPLME